MTTLNTKTLLAGCLMAALAACGGNSNGATGTGGGAGSTGAGTNGTTAAATASAGGTATTASTASATGGTTGSSCTALNGSCLHQACCSNLTCNSSDLCVATLSTTTTGGSTGGGDPCTLSAANGPRGTSLDCADGLYCASNGTCQLLGGVISCTQAGHSPAADGGFCCESDVSGSCGTFVACAPQGNACSASVPCCNGGTCNSGTCVASCGGQAASCTTSADCCLDQGYTCTPIPDAGNLCFQEGLAAQLDQSTQEIAPCASFPLCQAYDAGSTLIECQLGALCDLWVGLDAGGGDPCAPLGLVCDTTGGNGPEFGSCREPTSFESCIPGLDNCQPLANSTVQQICINGVFSNAAGTGTAPLCDQPCKQSSDCVSPTSTCITRNAADVCGAQSCTTTQFYGKCSSVGTDDGLCAPLGAQGNSQFPGLCIQSAPSGVGGPGTECNIGGNRQVGGLCDTSDYCNSGLCEPICNSGTGTAKGCPSPMTCVGAVGFWETGDAQDFGACVTTCDFTQLDGGGCNPTQASVATKCIPGELLSYGPASGTPIVDFCGPLAANAIPIGGDCTTAPQTDALDPCVVGALCYGNIGSLSCLQMCENGELGNVGAAGGCPANYTCTAINFSVGASTHAGVCFPPATGTTGTGGASTGGASTGGASTGGASTGAGSTGGASTGGGSTNGTSGGTSGSAGTGGTTG